jgi:hypothetical protein
MSPLIPVLVGIIAAAMFTALGFLIKSWVSDLSGDVQAVGTVVNETADRLVALSNRVASLEGWRDSYRTLREPTA